MKTHTGSFFNLTKPLCVLRKLFFGWDSLWLLLPLESVLSTLLIQGVIRGWNAGSSNVKIAFGEIISNNRVFVGVILWVGVAPLFWAHLLFINDALPAEMISPIAFIADPFQTEWFYHRWFYWFFTNREEFALILFLSGGFLLCKTDIKWGWKYAVVPVIAFNICEVIYQTTYISHWSHFYRSFFTYERGWELFALIVSTLYAGYYVVDYLVYRKYHTKDGNIARLIGMIKLNTLPVEQRLDILERLVDESENYNAR